MTIISTIANKEAISRRIPRNRKMPILNSNEAKMMPNSNRTKAGIHSAIPKAVT